MIRETKIMQETVKRQKFCDICGKELHIGLACSAARCQYCKKDLCEKCIGYEEDTTGDYRDVWCKKCWSIGEEYKPKIEELHEQIDRLYKEWQKKCKEE